MSVKFTYSGDTSPVEIEIRNPDPSNVVALELRQVVGRAAGGTRYVYDKGIQRARLELAFSNLSEAEKTALETFFNDTVNGGKLPFTFTDHLGNDWTAHFDQADLEFTETDNVHGSMSSYSVGGESHPTHEPEAGIYSVRIILEAASG